MKSAKLPASDENHLFRKLYLLASVIAIIVSLLPPAGYYLINYRFQKEEALIESRLQAAFLTQLIHAKPDAWEQDSQDLVEQDLASIELPESRILTNASGDKIASMEQPLPWPSIAQSTDIRNPEGKVIARISIQRSLLPILRQSLWISSGGILLGAFIFLILHTLPMRVIRNTLAALSREKLKAETNETRMRIIIESAAQGIISLSEKGIIESFNQAATSIFGYSAAEIQGKNIEALLPHVNILRPGMHQAQANHMNGRSFPAEVTVSLAELGSSSQFICLVSDITERMRTQRKLHQMANYDSLTELPNRNLFRDRLTQAMLRSQRSKMPFALMYLDLNKFKHINDTYGHHAGDQLLCHVATLLQGAVRKTDSVLRNDLSEESTVSRLGGDEFTIILEHLGMPADAGRVAEKIIDAFATPVNIAGTLIYPSTSIGIAIFPEDTTDQDELIKLADAAMYRAKSAGQNLYFFSNRTFGEPDTQSRMH